MNLIKNYARKIFNLSRQYFLKLCAVIALCILCVSVLFIYMFYHQKHKLLNNLTTVYKQRNESQDLVFRNNAIKQQEEIVTELLKKNKDFKLLQFFDSTIDQLRLTKYVISKGSPKIESKNSSLSEISLDTKISNINMKQVVEVLQKIEASEIVFIKKLDIKKTGKMPTVDIELTIATLQLKSE